MVNFFDQSRPEYHWMNLHEGIYTFKFSDLNKGEPVTLQHKFDYFKYPVVYIWSDVPFYNNPKCMEMDLVLPYKAFIIGLNLYKDRKALNNLKDCSGLYVTLLKKNRKVLIIMDIRIAEERKEEDKPSIEEEVI